jgi:hypothetical protein
VWTQDVLNLGVKPDRLVTLMRQKLEATGGKVYEEVQLVSLQCRCWHLASAVMQRHTKFIREYSPALLGYVFASNG